MYILEYWISESEQDWYENLAVANSIDTLKNSPQLYKKLQEILKPARNGGWEIQTSGWRERGDDFIRGIIRKKIQLVLDTGTEIKRGDRGYLVIRPIDYVEGN